MNDVVWIGGAKNFREHVADTGSLHDGANRTSSDNARSCGGRPKEYLTRTEMTVDTVRNRCPYEWDAEDVLARLLIPLADGIGDLVRLAEPDAHVALAVSNNDERAEAEPSAAFNYLGHAIDVYDALGEVLERIRIDACHLLVPSAQNSRPASRAASARALIRPW